MEAPIRRVVIIGFMAAGKTTIGRLLADRLGWKHIDLDAEIEREQGESIARIFARDGEPRFRALEASISARWIDADRVVITPGGGWPENPGVPDTPPAGTLTVWLRVGADELVRRVQAGLAPGRPLLEGDAEARVRSLLARREPIYRRADVTVDAETTDPAAIAAEIHRIVRSRR